MIIFYSFFPDGRYRSKIAYHHPEGGMSPYADEITIGELYLREGQRMLYLFDYGDEWLFNILLEKIDEGKESNGSPEIIESEGEAPEQYPDYEDEEYEDY